MNMIVNPNKLASSYLLCGQCRKDGLGAVLMQNGRVIMYTLRSPTETGMLRLKKNVYQLCTA